MNSPAWFIYASQTGAKLDSSVHTGGGTDDTAILQAVLDKAPEMGRLHLVLDGAALVTGLRVHANTTIECPDSDCGLFLADDSDCALLRNANQDEQVIRDHDISLIGGTYNQNGLRQTGTDANGERLWIFNLHFVGVERLILRDLTIRNQATFSVTVRNFRHVFIQNVWIDLPGYMKGHNQDGFHFFGPGQHLTIRDVGGRTGDDFICLGPDELDQASSITDVLIDGVTLEHADQAIRMLSCGTGRLDRVTVRNVTGTYTTYGFYLCPWFGGNENPGNYGSITFENIALQAEEPQFDYAAPFLFSIGGKFEALTLRNIQHIHPRDGRRLFRIGYPGGSERRFKEPPLTEALLIDGLRIVEDSDAAGDNAFITLQTRVRDLTLRNVEVIRPREAAPRSVLLRTLDGTDVEQLTLSDIHVTGMRTVLEAQAGHIEHLDVHHVVTHHTPGGAYTDENGVIAAHKPV